MPLNDQILLEAANQRESARLLQLRLAGFVGREAEQAAIRELIDQTRVTGGYVLVTGEAGAGKSSLIAQLIVSAGLAQTPQHFIALTPGRAYQLDLLRSIVAQLMLKHDLSGSYFPADSYPALRLEFGQLLQTLSARGISETIYLDGLDQLQPEVDGSRDLSFLPLQLPPGIVIVLGSRPNETIASLALEQGLVYSVPPLSEHNAIGRWQQVQPMLEPALLHGLAQSVKGNALLVELAANLLHQTSAAELPALLNHASADSTNLFRLSLERIEHAAPNQWQPLLRPLLAVLLVTQEPLQTAVLAMMLEQPVDAIAEALALMSDWVSVAADQRVALRHLLFHDFLIDHEFAAAERRAWHGRMAQWCGMQLEQIWQDSAEPIEQARRWYARQHYITHLDCAEQWEELWRVIDLGDYGEYKVRFEPSTRLYGLDLDRARESVIAASQNVEQQLELLPRLWRYSLLRTSLSAHADRWRDEIYVMLAVVGRLPEALAQINVCAYPERQVLAWARVIRYAEQHIQLQLLQRIEQAIRSIRDPEDHAFALSCLGLAYAEAGIPNAKYPIYQVIDRPNATVQGLLQQANTLASQGLDAQAYLIFDQVLTIIYTIRPPHEQLYQLMLLVQSAKRAGYDSLCEQIIQSVYVPQEAPTFNSAIQELAKAYAANGDFAVAYQALQLIKQPRSFIQAAQQVAMIACEKQIHTHTANLLQAAHKLVNQLEDIDDHIYLLGQLAIPAWHAGLIELAQTLMDEAFHKLIGVQHQYPPVATRLLIRSYQSQHALADALAIISFLDNPKAHDYVLGNIIECYLNDNDLTNAHPLLKLFKTHERAYVSAASNLLIKAGAQGLIELTWQVYWDVMDISKAINDHVNHLNYFVHVACTLATEASKHGLADLTPRLYSEALQACATVDHGYTRLRYLKDLVLAQMKYGLVASFPNLLDSLRLSSTHLDINTALNEFLCPIAAAYAKQGNHSAFDDCFNYAHTQLKNSPQTDQKSIVSGYRTLINSYRTHATDWMNSAFLAAVLPRLQSIANTTHLASAKNLLINIYSDYASEGHAEFLAQAYQMALTIEPIADRIDALKSLAKAYAIVKDGPRLRAIIAELMELESDDLAVESIALVCAKQGDYTYAQELLALQVPSPWKDEVVWSLIDKLIQTNQVTMACQLIPNLSEYYMQEREFQKIIAYHLERQQVAEIGQIVQDVWRSCTNDATLWELSTIIVPLIPHYPWLGSAVLDSMPWVEQQLARLN
ncbi:ATP-binding protein [Herpetosiphon gulosus]|uniref:Orc1-like AAA ATPase domain-containing protein n=1 Tax=Herpetosiphon gulosus TaxID=1973496 RepID=A0ABP9X934_9CHLR